MASELKMGFNHLLIECQRNVSELKLLFLNYMGCIDLALEIITSYFSKIIILGGNNRTVVWPAACLISDLFDKRTDIELSLNFAQYQLSLAKLQNKSDIRQQLTK